MILQLYLEKWRINSQKDNYFSFTRRRVVMTNMRFYEIEADFDYQGIEPVDLSGKHALETMPRLKNWVPPEYYINNPLLKETDFFLSNPVFGIRKSLVQSIEVDWDEVELLPISLEGETEEYFLFSPIKTKTIDCIDQERAKRDSDGWITDYAFDVRHFNKPSLFRIEPSVLSLFCVTGFEETNNDFYISYHEKKMKGLTFSLIAG